jgi:hypothetical protein
LDNKFNPSGSSYTLNNSDVTKWGNTGSSAKWGHKWGNRLYSNLMLAYSSYFNERNRISKIPTSYTNTTKRTEKYSEENNLNDYSAKLDMEYKLDEYQQLSFGLNANQTKTDFYLNENDTTTILDNNIKANLFSAYLQDKLMLCDTRLEITGGLRASYYSPTKKSYFEPRATAAYAIDKNWKVKGSAGYYYQFAKKITREDIMQGNRDFWLMADGESMPVGSSLQGVLGFSYETKDYLIDVEGYYKKLYDISEYSIRTVNMDRTFGPGGGMMEPGMHGGMGAGSGQNTIYSDRFYTGNGYARGVDFLLQKKYGDFTGWVSYTLGEVIHNFPDLSDKDYYASNDVTHELKLVGIYKWRNWNFSANWLLATGKPYTAPEGIYKLTLPDGTEKSYFTPSAKNGKRLPAYHRFDVAATYNFKISEKFPCSVNVSLFNLYNRNNVWYKEFQIVDEEIVETNINYLGITPNVNFSIKF